jgi:hypothetical protein
MQDEVLLFPLVMAAALFSLFKTSGDANIAANGASDALLFIQQDMLFSRTFLDQ